MSTTFNIKPRQMLIIDLNKNYVINRSNTTFLQKLKNKKH